MESPTSVSKTFIHQGMEFVKNNYSMILTLEGVPNEFHLLQDFFSMNTIGYALTHQTAIFAKSVLQILTTAIVHSSSHISFNVDEEVYDITTALVKQAFTFLKPIPPQSSTLMQQ